jgi:hypothetical protein
MCFLQLMVMFSTVAANWNCCWFPCFSGFNLVICPLMKSVFVQDQEVEVSSVARERRTHAEPVACTGAVVMVCVTYTCGVRKEFCFDHCH